MAIVTIVGYIDPIVNFSSIDRTYSPNCGYIYDWCEFESWVDRIINRSQVGVKGTAHRFADVETLHVLSFQPMMLESLISNLKKTFGLSITFTHAYEIVSNLEVEELVSVFRRPTSADSRTESNDVYGITPKGP
jgi:hypothetical protein